MLQSLYGWLSQIATFADNIGKIVGLFGYVLAFYSFVQQRVAQKAHEQTLASLVASLQPGAAAAAAPTATVASGALAPQAAPASTSAAPAHAAPGAPHPQPPAPKPQPPVQKGPAIYYYPPVAAQGSPAPGLPVLQPIKTQSWWKTFRASLNHPAIFWGGVVAQVMCFAGIALLVASYNTRTLDAQGYYVYTTTSNGYLGGGFTLLFFGLLLGIGFFIGSLVSAIRMRNWRWALGILVYLFATYLALPFIGQIFYGMRGPTKRGDQAGG